MSLNTICKIIFTQTPRDAFPTRSKSFTLTLVNTLDTTSSWQDLTDTVKLKFPKKVYFTDELGNKVTWEGKAIIGNGIGGQVTPPILLRGDKIQVYFGYDYNTVNGRTQEMNLEFEGYVSKVIPRIPLEVECEDAMFLMKQIQTPNKVFTYPAYNVRTMLQEMVTVAQTDPNVSSYIKQALIDLNLKIVSGTPSSTIVDVSVGTFRTQNDTISTVMDRLKKDERIYTYFRKIGDHTELRCSGIVYWPNDAVRHKFQFQKNILPDDKLEYKRQDDIQLGAKVYSVNKVELSALTKAGNPTTKHKRLETFVGAQGGEIRTLYFWDVTDVNKLKELGKKELSKFYYEGFFGSFTAFGLPSVKHGDIVDLIDAVLPERNGSYYVKNVKKSFGIGGIRQVISIHFKVYNADGTSLFTQDQINAGL